MLVTVVNVFGNWFGDFVTPGSVKETSSTANSGVGGSSNQNSVAASSSSASSSSSSSSQSTQPVTTVNSTGAQTRVSSLTQTQIPQARVASNSIVFADSNSEVLASSNISDSVSENTAKQVNLNLAWLLPVFGIGVLLALARARFRAK